MSKVFLTGDWHLGHKNILKYRPKFKTIEEHDETIFKNYKKLIKKRDTVYFMGDICFDKSYLDRIKELRGNKILVLGNHDSQFIDTKDFVQVFDKVIAIKNYKGAWLVHFPVHPDELRHKYCVHGHTHNIMISDSRYFNTCVDVNDYTPVYWNTIIEKLKSDNPEFEEERRKRYEIQ